MEKQSSALLNKRKHKSDFFTSAKGQGRLLKPKRFSCMGASQLLQMEESKGQIVNFLIEQILSNVFDQINQMRIISELCKKQMQQKVNIIDNYEIYNMQMLPQQFGISINLQQQPKNQQKHRVLVRKQKVEQTGQNMNLKQLINNQTYKNNSSNSKTNTKFYSKQKLHKLTNTLTVNPSNKSIKSVKSNIGNSYRIPKSIEEESQNDKEKQRKQKDQIIKKLMREYQLKIKESQHFCPEPLLHQYRSFFTQPQTRQQQDLRTSFLYLREVREVQEKLTRHKSYKKTSASMIIGDTFNKENLRTTKLPGIHKSGVLNKKQQNISLFTQDENGKIIKIKNNQRIDTLSRDYSMTTHQSSFTKKPQQTALKQISNIFKVNYEYLKNDKIKDQSTFMNENTSLISTVCQSMDEQMLQKSLMENFTQKKGVIIKKPTFTHRSSMSVELEGVKLPSIMMKRK